MFSKNKCEIEWILNIVYDGCGKKNGKHSELVRNNDFTEFDIFNIVMPNIYIPTWRLPSK